MRDRSGIFDGEDLKPNRGESADGGFASSTRTFDFDVNLTETLIDVTAHAEMQALTAAASSLGGKYLADCTLYVTVEPCVMCAGAIGWSQLGRLVYGAPDEKRGYRRYAPEALHPKTVVLSGVLQEECAELMKRFFQSRR